MSKRATTGAIFALIAAILIVSATITYSYGRGVVRAHRLATDRRGVIAQLERVLSFVTDAETGQRGFIVTGDESYLAPFDCATKELPAELKKLGEMPLLQHSTSDIARINELVRDKLGELRRTIDLRRDVGAEAAGAAVATGVGKQTMDELRSLIGRMRGEQEELLTRENEVAETMSQRRTMIFAGTSLLNLFFVFWAYQRIATILRDEEQARREAEEQRAEAQRRREYLAVTLASIGDCVIVTDADGRITFMNTAAEKLTGWNLADAQAHVSDEVFKIINEQTRQVVESPVEKVIRSGSIVGLANHTLLVRRDGSEVPIDDSGAPIRDREGKLHGVVLVFRDFSQRRKTERDLQEAKDAAETANRAKDQFLAMLSHELRTPLTPVLATLSVWESLDGINAEQARDVNMMRRNVELEARIIDDLLDLTRVSRGRLSLSPENTDVHQLVRFLVSMSQSEINDKQLNVSLDLKAERHHVHTDPSRLQQVLWNILRNAIKFTDSGGAVAITTQNDGADNVVIRIADNGIGMTQEKIARLGIPFERSARAGSDPHGGLGLGMAISHSLINLLHGELKAESPGPGEGSTFTITFPTVEAAEQRSAAVGSNANARKPMRVLVVEDHADTARVLVRLLTSRGFVVDTADTVASAMAKVREKSFDALVCDIGLPDGTGFELIERVRKVSQTPAVALSGFGTLEDVARSKEAGFTAHLTKPINFHKLEATIWQIANA